jgi:rubrerythrin
MTGGDTMNALEVAKKMEVDAIRFYTEAAEKTRYPAGKKMFLTITEDEKRHLEMISQVIKGLNITAQDVSPLKRVKTVFESMKDDMMKKVEASHDELEAFKIAMQMEQEGEQFYKKALGEVKTVFESMKDDMMKKVEASHDELEAFKIAMQMEQEGEQFYKKALGEAKTEKEKALFTRLIEEERQHYQIFSNTYFFLKNTGSWFLWEEHAIVDGGTPWA